MSKVETIKINEQAQFTATLWRRFALIQMYGGRSKFVELARAVVADNNNFDNMTIGQMLPGAGEIDAMFFKLLDAGKIGATNEGE